MPAPIRKFCQHGIERGEHLAVIHKQDRIALRSRQQGASHITGVDFTDSMELTGFTPSP
ncbi:MAG: hypothetical protein WAM09_16870 [Anaerolineales bacterium]